MKNNVSAYQEQFLGLYTKQKNDFSNNETNSFLGALNMRDHFLCAHKKLNHWTAELKEGWRKHDDGGE